MNDTEKYQAAINAYFKHDKNQSAAAESLGIHRRSFKRHLDKAIEEGLKPKIKVRAATIEETPPPITGVYFTDAHNQPKLNTDRFYWLASLVNDLSPDYLVCGGDFDDLPSLCSHEKNDTYRGKFKPSFQDDLEASEEAHSVLSEAIKVPVEKRRTLGNHEQRLFSFEDRNPEVYGMMQHAYFDILNRHGWEYTSYGEYMDIGGVDFTHTPLDRMGRPTGGKRLCVNLARDSVRDIVCGHTHEKNIHTETKYGPNRSVTAVNGGCFMPERYTPDYAQHTYVNYWRGCFFFQIEEGKIRVREYTLADLRKEYG